MEIGIDSFVASHHSGPSGDVERVRQLLEQIELADREGLDVFGIGEHHRPDYVSSAPAVLLAAAAARTSRIRLASAVTVLGTEDPVRVFQQFATVDLLARGRAEIVAGRGSFVESYPLFGCDLEDYDALFAEKLDLLLRLRTSTRVSWSGRFRSPIDDRGVYPRPAQARLPVWIASGGTPASIARAARLGLPVVVAVIGGRPAQFRPLFDRYRSTASAHATPGADHRLGLHSIGFVADTDAQARETFWPGWRDVFTRLGRERGWAPPSRAQYEAQCDPDGALVVGSPETVTAKISATRQALGALDRVNVVLDNALLTHEQTMHATHLLATRVAPALRAAVD
jgi:probable LLM family oxidoreductase